MPRLPFPLPPGPAAPADDFGQVTVIGTVLTPQIALGGSLEGATATAAGDAPAMTPSDGGAHG